MEIVIFIIGLGVGSFLSVCIYRLPRGLSILNPGLRCPECGRNLRGRELFPAAGYLFLRGRCRYCRRLISRRLYLVALLTAVLYLAIYKLTGWGWELIGPLLFTAFLIVIAFIDYDYKIIPDKILLWLAGLGVLVNIIINGGSIVKFGAGFLLGGLLLLAIAIASRGGMGGGDIKFAAAIGLWLGVKNVAVALLLAFLGGGLWCALLLVIRLKRRKDYIPFGPFISGGAFLSMLFGDRIVQWYLSRIT